VLSVGCDANHGYCFAQREPNIDWQVDEKRVIRKRSKTMKANLNGPLILAVASACLCGIAVAQNLQEITVQGTRILSTKTVGRNATTNSPIVDVSVSYGVRVADLDLASNYGPIQLEKRVRDAAMAACKEIGRQYPDATPSEELCAKAAADKAMVTVHDMVAVAKATAK
jgi:UrcA family protein